MHCPACNKDFSPVHSRCPDCNGWLRTKSASSTAKASAGAPALAGPAKANVGLAAPSSPKSSGPLANGSQVPLPARPSLKPAAAAPVAAVSPPPAAAPNTLPRPSEPEPASQRGGLGSGWETSDSFPVPSASWPSAMETGKMPAFSRLSGTLGEAAGMLGTPPAPPQSFGQPLPGQGHPSGSLAPPSGPLGPPQGQPLLSGPSSQPQGSLSGSLGQPQGYPSGSLAQPSPFPANSGHLGQPPAQGPPSGHLGQAPPLGASPVHGIGGSAAAWGAAGAPSSQSGPVPSGWLGGEGVAPATRPSTPTLNPRPEASWNGAGEAPPVAPSPSGPALALPDHTVFVEIEGEGEAGANSASSNKVIFMVLGLLLVGLLGFVGYLHRQQGQLKQQKPPAIPQGLGAMDLGLISFKQANLDYKAKRWEEAQQQAEMAHDLIVPLKVAPPKKVKEVKAFFDKATRRWGQALYDRAQQARQAGDSRQALALCEASAAMYAKLPKSGPEQARAHGLQGDIFARDGDTASAQRSYTIAERLAPKRGYRDKAQSLRSLARPQVEPAPEQAPEEVPMPSLGETPYYPPGSSSGGYRPSTSGAGTAPSVASDPAPQAPKPRPVNDYQPPPPKPKHKPKSDVLPTY